MMLISFETIISYVDLVNEEIWSYLVIPLLVCCALYFTYKLRGIQFLQVIDMFRQLLVPAQIKEPNIQKHVGSFQAFAVSLSSRVGTGNLAGVASAIFIGGPGAVFWMWTMAIFGAATAFVEATLAQLFKRKGKESFYGGPAYYMQHGLHCRWMGWLFAVALIFGFGISQQIVQSNTVCDIIGNTFHCEPIWIGAILGVVTIIIIFGGIHRISHVLSMIVPLMAIGYIGIALYILLANIAHLYDMLVLIVKSAFGWSQVAGGSLGIAVMQGVKRGLFSNEAGEGSAPNAAATATVSHPVKQGLVQALGVYIDTLVICTCTAFIILLSGLYTGSEDGVILTAHAMDFHLGEWGRWFLTAAIFLFAYSTIIANYYYGEANILYLTRKKWILQAFRTLTGILVFISTFLTLQQAWSIVDLAMAMMTLLNLIALALLGKYAFALWNDYSKQKKEGKDPVFTADIIPSIKDDLEAWK